MNAIITRSLSIVLVDLRYPYGKSKIYMNGSLCSIAAVLIAAGHTVKIVDLNIDNFEDSGVQVLFSNADLVGISMIGAPYIPSSIEFLKLLKSRFPKTAVILGGQVIERLSEKEFASIYGDLAIQIKNPLDLANALECQPTDLAEWTQVPLHPVWQSMGHARLREYLSTEFTLVLSQGCKYACLFCAAWKNLAEQFQNLELFSQDMRYLVAKAEEFGIKDLWCYASSLDFFQNPETVAQYLEVLAEVQQTCEIKFHVRCLSCPSSLVEADRALPELQELLRGAGLYCVGFGVDGVKDDWESQNKKQNDEVDIAVCLAVCRKLKLQTEVLVVLGFPKSTYQNLKQLVLDTVRYVSMAPGVSIRPYVDKETIPGNREWKRGNGRVKSVLTDTSLFYNLDFAACASKLTDPDWRHRVMVNFFYLLIIAMYKTIDRCPNNPLFPQGGKGILATLAKVLNSFIPFDR